MRRLVVVLLGGAGGLVFAGLLLLRPYLDHPALMQDPYAVSDALADVAVVSLAMDVRGVDLLAAPEPSEFHPPRPHRPLCSAAVLASGDFPPESCRPVRVARKIGSWSGRVGWLAAILGLGALRDKRLDIGPTGLAGHGDDALGYARKAHPLRDGRAKNQR